MGHSLALGWRLETEGGGRNSMRGARMLAATPDAAEVRSKRVGRDQALSEPKQPAGRAAAAAAAASLRGWVPVVVKVEGPHLPPQLQSVSCLSCCNSCEGHPVYACTVYTVANGQLVANSTLKPFLTTLRVMLLGPLWPIRSSPYSPSLPRCRPPPHTPQLSRVGWAGDVVTSAWVASEVGG